MLAEIINFENRDYKEIWDYQLRLVEERALNKIRDTLILVEHSDVVTLGRRGKHEDVLTDNYPVYNIERGGEATYHGPGQLVGYPIIHISQRGTSVLTLVRMIEEVLIQTSSEFHVDASRINGKPGVWVNGKKIASIGIAIRHWVTFHGFALNVNTDISKFNCIRPCGMESSVMTSIEKIRGERISMEKVKESIIRHFGIIFGYEIEQNVSHPPLISTKNANRGIQ